MSPTPYPACGAQISGAAVQLTWPRGADAFFVCEQPAYLPSGEGEHLFLWVRKQNVAAAAMLKAVAQAFAVPQAQVGYAGLKDTFATTWQWLSVPRQAAVARLGATADAAAPTLAVADGVQIVSARWHANKLRCGHLRGSTFALLLGQLAPAAERLLAARCAAIATFGMVNSYGHQRFGPQRRTAILGRRLLAGNLRQRLPGWQLRLAISAVQSEVFNQVVARRLAAGCLGRALAGDVMQVRASGGVFVCQSPELDQARLEAAQIAGTGPMWGDKMRAAEGAAAELEAAAVADLGLEPGHFANSRLASGTRRPLWVLPEHLRLQRDRQQQLWLHAQLPAGSYVTELLGQLLQAHDPLHQQQPLHLGQGRPPTSTAAVGASDPVAGHAAL